MARNYVGITGCTTPLEVEQVLDCFNENGFSMESNHVPMLGFLISPRNKDPSWHSARYPQLEIFDPLIEMAYGRAFVTIHIDEKATSAWEEDLYYLLEKIKQAGCIDGIQVNVMHPKLEDIKKLRDKLIIMQYSTDYLSKNVDQAIDEFRPMARYIDYALIDPSRGAGIEIDVQNCIPHYKELRWNLGLRVGFAGGLNPENIEGMVRSIIEGADTRDFCLDVESGVRTNNQLDIVKVKDYLHALSNVIHE